MHSGVELIAAEARIWYAGTVLLDRGARRVVGAAPTAKPQRSPIGCALRSNRLEGRANATPEGGARRRMGNRMDS